MKLLIVPLMIAITTPARAAVTTYTNDAAWQSAAGDYSTIHFTEFPEDTHITNQYADLGVTFTDGLDIIYHSNAFEIDGAGLNGAFSEATLSFDAPQYSIATHFPGIIQFKLFNDGELVFTSGVFNPPGAFGFAGLVSTSAFDAATIFGPTGSLKLDELYFGPPIPAPGALALLGLAALMTARARRRVA